MDKRMQTIVFKNSKSLETGDLVIKFIMAPTSVAHMIIDEVINLTLFIMTSKNKNGGYSWGTLQGTPMEKLAFRYDTFRYDRYEESKDIFG